MPESPHTTTPHGEVPGLVAVLQVLRKRWWVIAICAAVSVAVAVVYVQRQARQYVATASLQFTTNSLPSQVAGVQVNQSLDPEGVKSTNVQLVTTAPVAARVIAALHLKVSPSKLLQDVKASDPHDDYIVDVAATAGTPKRAAQIANAFVAQYVSYSQIQNEAVLVNGEQLINSHLAQLPATDTVQRRNLQALSQKLLLLQAVQASNAQVADAAVPPGSPSSPKKKTTVGVALVFGLLLGVGIALLLNLIDRRVTSLEEFEELYGVPALASIPRLPRVPKTAREREIALEPFHILHNGLSLLAGPDPVKTVLVTSAIPGEGKTTVALELARAAAIAGQRVILVEADLRRPVLERRLGLDQSTLGLTSALEDGADPVELLQPAPGLPQLAVLPCGPPPRTATSALKPDVLRRTFGELAAMADLLVVDSAPLLPVADTRVMLDEVGFDVCLMVARAGTTKRDEVRRARAVFEQRRLRTVGLVINDLADVSEDYYDGERGRSPEAAEPPEPKPIGRDSEYVGSG